MLELCVEICSADEQTRNITLLGHYSFCSSVQINLFPISMFWEGRPSLFNVRTSVRHFRIMQQINKKVMLTVEMNTIWNM